MLFRKAKESAMNKPEHSPFLPLRIHSWSCLTVDSWDFELKYPFWRCYLNEDPGAEIFHGCDRIPLQEDKVYLIAPYTRLRTHCDNPFRQLYAHFSLEWRSAQLRDRIFVLPRQMFPPELISRISCSAFGSERDGLMGIYAFVTTALFLLEDVSWNMDADMDQRIRNLIRKIDGDFCRPWSNRELARLLFMSENGFIRLFTSNAGSSPQVYLKLRRIEKACELLHFTDETIDEIASKTGFANRYHFSKVFFKIIGSWPAAFRDSKNPWHTARRGHPHKKSDPASP